MERTTWIGSLTFCGLVLAGILACGGGPTGGARSDGGCPDGETCSSATPTGLYFSGTRPPGLVPPFVSPLYPVAPGGTETIQLWTNAAATSPFLLAFVATTAEPSVVAVTASGGGMVRIAGHSTGWTQLRIVEPDGTTLYDSVAVTTRVPNALGVTAQGQYLPPTYDEDGGTLPTYALLAGTHAHLEVWLSDADALPWGVVADESALATASVSIAQLGPNLVDVTVPADATTVELTLTTGGGAALHGTLPVVSAVDIVADGPSTSLVIGETATVCLGASTIDGLPIASDAWSAVVRGGVATARVSPIAAGCFDVTATTVGTGTLAGTLGTLHAAASIAVTDGSGAHAALVAADARGHAFPLTATPGDIAASR